MLSGDVADPELQCDPGADDWRLAKVFSFRCSGKGMVSCSHGPASLGLLPELVAVTMPASMLEVRRTRPTLFPEVGGQLVISTIVRTIMDQIEHLEGTFGIAPMTEAHPQHQSREAGSCMGAKRTPARRDLTRGKDCWTKLFFQTTAEH